MSGTQTEKSDILFLFFFTAPYFCQQLSFQLTWTKVPCVGIVVTMDPLSSSVSVYFLNFSLFLTNHMEINLVEMLSFPELLSSPLVFSGVHIARSLVFCVVFSTSLLYPRSPKGERGILFYLCPSVRPSKIFFVAFFSVTVDGRNLIFGHKRHIGIPYRGKRFWTHQIPTSCLPTVDFYTH